MPMRDFKKLCKSIHLNQPKKLKIKLRHLKQLCNGETIQQLITKNNRWHWLQYEALCDIKLVTTKHEHVTLLQLYDLCN